MPSKHQGYVVPGEEWRPEPLDFPGSARLGRRALLGAAAAGLLTARMTGPALAKARHGDATASQGAGRRSRITRGTTLVHADLHNHTLLSDGDGNPRTRSCRCGLPAWTSPHSLITRPCRTICSGTR